MGKEQLFIISSHETDHPTGSGPKEKKINLAALYSGSLEQLTVLRPEFKFVFKKSRLKLAMLSEKYLEIISCDPDGIYRIQRFNWRNEETSIELSFDTPGERRFVTIMQRTESNAQTPFLKLVDPSPA